MLFVKLTHSLSSLQVAIKAFSVIALRGGILVVRRYSGLDADSGYIAETALQL